MYKIVDFKETDTAVAVKIELDNLWTSEVNKISVNRAKDIKLPGFRKGKVPFEQAKRYLNLPSVFQSAFSNCMRKVVPLVFADEQIKKHDVFTNLSPEFKIDKMNENSLGVTLEFALNPKISLPDYHKITITAKKQIITDDDVKKEVQNMLTARAEMVVKQGDIVEEDDVAIVTFTGKVDGKNDERLCMRSCEVYRHSATAIPGFFDHLLGMKRNEERAFILKLPAEQFADLSLKEAQFSVKLEELKTLHYPTLDEALIKEWTNGEAKTSAEFDGWLKQKLQENANMRYEQQVKEEILKYLLENTKFNYIPEQLVENEYQRRVENLDRFFENQMNMNFEKAIKADGLKVDEVKKSIHTEVENNIKVLFLLKQIASVENLQPTSAELKVYRDSLANSSKPEDRQLMNLDDNELMERLVNNRVIDALYKWNCLEV